MTKRALLRKYENVCRSNEKLIDKCEVYQYEISHLQAHTFKLEDKVEQLTPKPIEFTYNCSECNTAIDESDYLCESCRDRMHAEQRWHEMRYEAMDTGYRQACPVCP